MHSSIALLCAVSSLYVATVTAAPAGLSPIPQNVYPSQSIPTSATPTTSSADMATVTPAPARRKPAHEAIRILEQLVLPQSISSSSTSSVSSSTFVFMITRPTKPAAKPSNLAARMMTNEDTSFGPLADLVFPQKISSSVSSTSSRTAFELSPTRHPLAVPVAAGP